MDENTARWRQRWIAIVNILNKGISQSGLGDVARTSREAFQPMMPLVSELVWLVQPLFAIFGEGEAANALAELLVEPTSLTSSEDSQGL